MRKGTFNFIEQILLDYKYIDQHIEERFKILCYPVVEYEDENIGGSRGTAISNPTERLALTISDDVFIESLRRNKRAVNKVLRNLDPQAKKVIELYYFDVPRKYTWVGIAQQCNYSEKQCRNIRNLVFERIAKELGLPI
ncbi:MAG TPA: DUF722 domain-containing protein [Candidatus Jeotgalibaca merdavium]|uniref:DUF722 domain-containing protein n=1 Tax=Candidatus Jeotgalibaca merdavium TaxID=2838627 RepID=A0A9D2I2V4_9LACT|nr:DUF722 domain-containing protein [Candidatus Jeotgalibaca merdavium]